MRQLGNPVGEQWLLEQFILPDELGFDQTIELNKAIENERPYEEVKQVPMPKSHNPNSGFGSGYQTP